MHEKRLKEIQERKNELKKIEERSDASEEELKNAIQEAKDLNQEEQEIKKSEEERKLIESNKEGKEVVQPQKMGERKMEENILETKEYRSAFLKNLQGKKLEEAEERALSSATASVGAVIPTITSDLIMEKVEQSAPLLNEIELLRINGNVTFSIEADATEANIHTEGATISDDGDALIPVSLSSYEITKYLTISKTVAKMSVDAFEKWLVNMLAKRIARKITKLIISGTGSNQPKGIAKANTWNTENSITVALNSSLTATDVTNVESLLPGAYDANAKWLMSKKTLFTDFKPLQDKSKNDIFVKEGSIYYVDGYPVMLDDSLALHEAYFGDFKMYAGNLSEDVTVDTDKKLSSNSFEYLGCAMFDGKPAIGEAFVKLSKATA